jgi:peptidoglycan/xylan/chitin deacetylase (PgdA/CDA1 family)
MQDRDLVGYGASPPRVRWPNDARVAISLVVNYEEGSENLLQDGIGRREMMGEGPSPVPPDRRDLANESFFEYGSRAGVWRLLRIFKKHGVRATFFACAVALERNPAVGPAITAEGHDVLGHGNRWPRLEHTGQPDDLCPGRTRIVDALRVSAVGISFFS